jgi:pimeloyl-ACP methyl ester carboxylesterase
MTTRRLAALLPLLAAAAACGGGESASAVSTVSAVSEVPTYAAEAAADPTAIRPFEVNIPEPVLEDLKARLRRTRYPDEIAGADWDYGTNLDYQRELLAYWADEFDWREQERQINELDHFKTVIDGLDIHFIHQRSPVEGATPLLISHGWPGSFLEFMKVIGPLTDPVAHGGNAEDAFHVVVPSIPGFGFSEKPSDRGYGPAQMGDIFAKLMERLGYERYGAQGGDWGSSITRRVAAENPDKVIGLHLNLITAGPPPGVEDPEAGVPAAELERMRERQAFWGPQQGYSAIQGTKPQTLGYALNDSPAGQAAWIISMVRVLCDCPGGHEDKFTKDELLANITLYWVTQTATSASRIYFESRRATGGRAEYIEVPTGAALFPKEIALSPRKWVEARYNIVRWTEMPRGGHFAALEEPELYVEDVRAFFAGLR